MIKEKKSVMDILFTFLLFCVFFICSFMVIIVGTRIYKNTIKNMNDNFDLTTATSYIVQKIRQNDECNSISIEKINNNDILVLTNRINDNLMKTYIYEYDDKLMEISVYGYNVPDFIGGQIISNISDFQMKMHDKLLNINITVKDMNKEILIPIVS